MKSIAHLFYEACTRFNKTNAVLTKVDGIYKPISHRFFKQRVSHFGRGLLSMGVVANEKIAILAETRFEWAIADLGIVSCAAVSVPIYPTSTDEMIAYILQHSECIGVVVSNAEQAQKVQGMRDQLPQLRFIVCMDPLPADADPDVLSLSQIEQMGTKEDNEDALETRWKALAPIDLLTIIYTSGTTGQPKGVMLTHQNIISNILNAEPIMPYHSGDTCLSHLPLSHIFERTAGYYTMLFKGVTIAYAEDIKTVADNLLEVKPTILISVPRLFEKIYTKIILGARANGFFKRQIFKSAQAIAKQAVPYLNSGKPMPGNLKRKYALSDRLVYSKIKTKTGGRLRACLTGGAPLAKEIGEFFTGFGIPLYEGYGLTETSPVVAVNVPGRNKPGTVGQPLKGVEVKIADDGEICVRGANVMLGYYKNAEATNAAIIDGWFHTGDIGILDEDHYLRITDRKKDLLVTSGGKNIAPQPLENALKLSHLIEHAVIIGDGRNFISALIFPPWETVNDWAPQQGWTTDAESLVKLPDFIQTLEKEVNQCMQNFAHYEKVKKFRVLASSLTVESGELTPSMKIKRKVINERFAQEIESMYLG